MNPKIVSAQDAMALAMKEKRCNHDYIQHGSPSAIVELCSSGLTILYPFNSLTAAIFDDINSCMAFAQHEDKIDSIRVPCHWEKIREKILKIEETWPDFVNELARVLGRDITVSIETGYLNKLSLDLKKYGLKRIVKEDIDTLLAIYLNAVVKTAVNGKWALSINGFEGHKYTFYVPYIIDQDGIEYKLQRRLLDSLVSRYPKFDLCKIIELSTYSSNIDVSGEVISKIPGIKPHK
ncbi:MAG: hypothetical protein J0L99_00310 [Chitinophagales bacterium]|nr:hypothetical protein [Chitinophagales bacterium]